MGRWPGKDQYDRADADSKKLVEGQGGSLGLSGKEYFVTWPAGALGGEGVREATSTIRSAKLKLRIRCEGSQIA